MPSDRATPSKPSPEIVNQMSKGTTHTCSGMTHSPAKWGLAELPRTACTLWWLLLMFTFYVNAFLWQYKKILSKIKLNHNLANKFSTKCHVLFIVPSCLLCLLFLTTGMWEKQVFPPSLPSKLTYQCQCQCLLLGIWRRSPSWGQFVKKLFHSVSEDGWLKRKRLQKILTILFLLHSVIL